MASLADFRARIARLQQSSAYKWYALAAVMLGTVMGPLDGSVVNVALATIARAFNTRVDNVEWVLLAYMLVTASTLILFGRLGDMIGQKRIYLAGFALFGLSSLACALAPALGVLIAARAVQGLGAAMLMSCTPAIITETFPAHERGRALGFNGAAVAVGLTSGPLLGGFIVTYADWRWIFLINVPISIVALIVAALVLKPEARQEARFDFAGAALGSSALLAVSLALSRAHVWGWDSPATLGLLAYFVIAVIAFVQLERRVPAPVLDLELFQNRTFALSVMAATLFFCATFSVTFIIPLAAQTVLDRNGLQAGLLLFPMFVLNVILAPLAGALSDRVPARYISTIGSSCFAIGALLLTALPQRPQPWMIVACLTVAGCGTAVFSQPNNNAIMGNAPPNRRGVAAGVLATARTTGQLLGVAVAGAVYFLVAQHTGVHSFLPAKAVFATVAAIMVIVSIISFMRD
ncbi:MAG: MFS transporter [Vulcanimicrobiaceae bacterium]